MKRTALYAAVDALEVGAEEALGESEGEGEGVEDGAGETRTEAGGPVPASFDAQPQPMTSITSAQTTALPTMNRG